VGPADDDQRQLKCCLVAAEVLLRDPADQGESAEFFLDRASKFVSPTSGSSSLDAEYHYRRLQVATLRKQEPDRQQRAEWLVQNAAGTAYEAPALVVVARAADQRVEQSPVADRLEAQRTAYRIYQRLVESLGTSPEILQSDQNARVALSRSADYAMQLEQYQDAAARLDSLVAAFPTDRNYLRRSGMAHFKAGSYPLSLERWRTLLTGIPSGTDRWYEAKYHQILCLSETDPEMAVKVLHQLEILDPKLGPPPWREKFQSLLRNFLK
jgi:tetratricopeptide (TPR) repeat protein